MAADISALGNLNPVEPLDMDKYADAKGFRPMAPKGEYNFRAPDAFPPFKDGAVNNFGRTAAGALSARIDPIIQGGEFDGTIVKFTKVSAKPFKRNGTTVSQLGDYLRACGIRGRLTDEQAQADAVEGTTNTSFKAEADWRAYNSKTGFSVEGMERFPSDGNGGHIPFYNDPTEKQKDENGVVVVDEAGNPKPLRLRAQLQITRFIPASNSLY